MGRLRAVRIFRDLIKSHNPDFVFLSETLLEEDGIKELADKCGCAGFYAVSRIEREGGLATMWKRNVDCHVGDASSNFIDIYIKERSIISWRLTCFYGFPERTRRHESWNLLRSLVKNDNVPWCIFGDFNDMMFAQDKEGPHPHPRSLLEGFKMAIDDCGLTELDLLGGNLFGRRVRVLKIG